MPGEVLISHQIELNQQLPNDVMSIARKQGEDPDQCDALVQELKDIIYGEFFLIKTKLELARPK